MLTLIADKIVAMFGINSLQTCVRVDIEIADKIVAMFGIDSFWACVSVDIEVWQDCALIWHW